jgi:hypothetical protein
MLRSELLSNSTLEDGSKLEYSLTEDEKEPFGNLATFNTASNPTN